MYNAYHHFLKDISIYSSQVSNLIHSLSHYVYVILYYYSILYLHVLGFQFGTDTL